MPDVCGQCNIFAHGKLGSLSSLGRGQLALRGLEASLAEISDILPNRRRGALAATAYRFAMFILSADGQRFLAKHGFTAPDLPQ